MSHVHTGNYIPGKVGGGHSKKPYIVVFCGKYKTNTDFASILLILQIKDIIHFIILQGLPIQLELY